MKYILQFIEINYDRNEFLHNTTEKIYGHLDGSHVAKQLWINFLEENKHFFIDNIIPEHKFLDMKVSHVVDTVFKRTSSVYFFATINDAETFCKKLAVLKDPYRQAGRDFLVRHKMVFEAHILDENYNVVKKGIQSCLENKCLRFSDNLCRTKEHGGCWTEFHPKSELYPKSFVIEKV